MVIGITGFFASGKGEAARYLEQHLGFRKLAYGDLIRQELTELGKPLGRDAEYTHANEQRRKHGFGYWSKKILASMRPAEDVVVEGIRNPGELTELSAAGDFHLIAVEAPLEVRFKRMLSRHKIGDPQTLTELKAKEQRETHSDDPIEQSIGDVIKKAEFVVDNSGSEQHLHQQLQKIVAKLKGT